jgi:hypothetical protein
MDDTFLNYGTENSQSISSNAGGLKNIFLELGLEGVKATFHLNDVSW